MIDEPTLGNQTVWNRWVTHARSEPDRDAIIHWTAGEEPYRWTYGRLLAAAECIAASLLEKGIRQGDVCAIIIRHNRGIYPVYMAVICVAAIPAVLAYPNPRLHPDKFLQGLTGMSQRSGLDWVLTERDLEATVGPVVRREGSTIRGIHFPLEWETNRKLEEVELRGIRRLHDAARGSDPLLLQHSSGTTGLQKPVLLSNEAVLKHTEFYGRAISIDPSDKIVSWLPLYHDMGLIAAFHLPLAAGVPTVQLDPFEWVKAPSLLLEAVTRERGTVSWLPNFAFNIMADKIHDEDLIGVDLKSWRLVVNCSEPIRHDSHRRFIERFRPYGLNPIALSTSYAMAETTFAVTQTAPGREPVTIAVDAEQLSAGRAVPARQGKVARTCVSSGRLIEGCSARIVDNTGGDVEDCVVGEIALRSVSMFGGYRNYPEKTAEVIRDGWYFSGDYGFRWQGEYFVIGRKKDLIIVAGNNVYPEDVEDAVSKVPGIIPGRVVAFGEEVPELGTERIAVIAETAVAEESERKRLRQAVVTAGASADVTISTVHLVPPRWLIKSSAGKPSRSANRARIASLESPEGRHGVN